MAKMYGMVKYLRLNAWYGNETFEGINGNAKENDQFYADISSIHSKKRLCKGKNQKGTSVIDMGLGAVL